MLVEGRGVEVGGASVAVGSGVLVEGRDVEVGGRGVFVGDESVVVGSGVGGSAAVQLAKRAINNKPHKILSTQYLVFIFPSISILRKPPTSRQRLL